MKEYIQIHTDSGCFELFEGFAQMDPQEIMCLMQQTYWADQRSIEQVIRAAENSCCFGIRDAESRKLIGYARVITDYATMFYLSDVIIDEEYRGQGLGKALIGYILDLPKLRSLKGVLFTKDAHELYRRFGFENETERAMVRKAE